MEAKNTSKILLIYLDRYMIDRIKIYHNNSMNMRTDINVIKILAFSGMINEN